MNCMASTMNFDKFRIRHAFFNIFNIRKNFSSYSPFIKRTGILSFSAHPTMKAEPRSHAPQAICEPFWVVSKSFFSHRFLYVLLNVLRFKSGIFSHMDTKLSMSSRSILSASRSSFHDVLFYLLRFRTQLYNFLIKESVHNLDIDMPS